MSDKVAFLIAIAGTYLVALAPPALARDIPKTDPNRIAILNAVRESADQKFVVKDLVLAGDLGYFCAMPVTLDAKGRPVYDETDGQLMQRLVQVVLRKAGGQWRPVKQSVGYVNSLNNIDCRVAGQIVNSSTDIARAEQILH